MNRDSSLEIYRSCEPVADTRYDPDGDQPVVNTLAEALATVADMSVTELPPLYETIDTDALTSLFETGSVTETILSFTVETWDVFIHSDGRIRICDKEKPTDPVPVFEPHST